MSSAVVSSTRSDILPGRVPHVLVVDDEPALLRAMARALRHAGFYVMTAQNGVAATELFAAHEFDAVLSDIRMPDMDGIQLLRALRDSDVDVPVILVTASPHAHTAQQAIKYGAFRYITKPVELETLEHTVRRAVQLREVVRLKSDASGLLNGAGIKARRTSAEASFERALGTMWMAYQPIVSGDRKLFGYEALLRSEEPALAHPDAVLATAERLGRQSELGRKVRTLAPGPVADDTSSGALFVNLHPTDLMDDMLLSPDAPLTAIAHRVVLEITERSSLEEVSNVRERVAALRELGFRIAIDDLGAGYAGLMSFARLEPDIVKLDMSLVRDVHRMPTKRKLIGSMIELCKDMGILVVGEGIETNEERDVLLGLGCDLFQGFLLCRPARALAGFSWD